MADRLRKQELLKRLLSVLVEEYGAADVEAILAILTKDNEPTSRQKKNRENSARTAVSKVKNEEIDEPRRSRIMKLAEKFDSKIFLPKLSDMQRFIELRGSDAQIHNRAAGFKIILSLLVKMSEEEFAIVERDAENSGPAQLGPLSKAIREIGDEAVQKNENSDDQA